MPQHNNILLDQKEAQIQLAIQALKQDATLSIYHAAATYNVLERTLRRQRAGTPYRRDRKPNSIALRGLEEVAIVRHIINIVNKGYPPQLANIEDIANSLLTSRL